MTDYKCAGCGTVYHHDMPELCSCGSVSFVTLNVRDPKPSKASDPDDDDNEIDSDLARAGAEPQSPGQAQIDTIVTAMLDRLQREIDTTDIGTASASFKNVCQGLAALSLVSSPDTITNA